MDLKIARQFSGHFIMISSRKVYGTNDSLIEYTEDSPYNPSDYYSWNKTITEKILSTEHENVTILRASNVFGFEYKRKTFMGFLMDQLKDKGNIEIDISPFSTKDFISVQDTCKLINLVVEKQLKGIYNISSGYGEMVGHTAEYLIKGYGSGNLISKSKERKDQFILNNKKLLEALNIEIDFNIEDQMKKLGEHLCKI
jgi:nucleoside-diphosphate-sugar epimerase